MRIPRIYTTSELRQGTKFTLEKKAGNHLVRVLRLKPGAEVILFNGQGGHFEAVIDNVTGSNVDITIGRHILHEVESPLEIILAQGISRGERMDYTIQKSVELGASRIIPLITERCGVKLDAERAMKRLNHWQGVVVGACEQCGRNHIPVIDSIKTLQDWLAQSDNMDESENAKQAYPDLKLVLDSHTGKTLSQYARPNGPVILLIGPEGGLTEDELLQVTQAGFAAVRLGPRTLRTETAGIAAISSLQSIWGDMT